MKYVLLTCVLIRLIFFLVASPWQENVLLDNPRHSDAKSYHEIAVSLLQNGQFTREQGSPPETLRTPAYPFFVAFTYAIAGQEPWIVCLLQIVLCTLTCWIIYLFAKNVFGSKPGLSAALLYAIYPDYALYSATTLLSETLFNFFLVSSLYISFQNTKDGNGWKRPRARNIFLGGLLIGLAILTRPVAVFLPLVYLAPIFFAYYLKMLDAPLKGVFSVSATLILGVLLALSPWLARNTYHYDAVFLSTSGSYNMLALNVASMKAFEENVSISEAKWELLEESEKKLQSYVEKPNPLQESKQHKKLAMEYILKDPALFLNRYANGVTASLIGIGSSNYHGLLGTDAPTLDLRAEDSVFHAAPEFIKQSSLSILLITAFILILLIFIYLSSIASLIANRNNMIVILCILSALYFLAISGAGGESRFRAPALIYLIVACSAIAPIFFEKLKSFRKRDRL